MLSENRTYLAEQNLKPDKLDEPIGHHGLNDFFTDCGETVYIPKCTL
jgi:heat shock protein HspQ